MNPLRTLGAALLLLCSGLLITCSPQGKQGPTALSMPRRTGFDLALILAPESDAAYPAIRAMRQELSRSYDVQTVAAQAWTPAGVARTVTSTRPRVVILLNNPVVRAYGEWASTVPDPPAAIILLSSFAQQLRRSVPNATGIAYEVPTLSTLAQLRSVLSARIRRVGVVHRQRLAWHVREQAQLMSVESLELITAPVDDEPRVGEVRRALVRLQDEGVDALWIINDNRLLTPRMLAEAWLPAVADSSIPVVVGVPSLMDPRRHFGTYAAVPDVDALGVQAADLIEQVRQLKWNADEVPVQPPLSVRTYLDTARARAIGLRPDALSFIDVIVDNTWKPRRRD